MNVTTYCRAKWTFRCHVALVVGNTIHAVHFLCLGPITIPKVIGGIPNGFESGDNPLWAIGVDQPFDFTLELLSRPTKDRTNNETAYMGLARGQKTVMDLSNQLP